MGNFTYTNAKFDNGAFNEKSIPLVPESKWSVGAVVEPLPGLRLLGQATGVDKQFALNDFNNLFSVNDYWTLGGRISYKKEGWEIFFKAENILSEEYSSFVTSDAVATVNYNPSPEQYFEGGFKIQI